MPETVHVGSFAGKIDRHPDHCPACHHRVIPKPVAAIVGGKIYNANVEIAYVCPNSKCGEMFIAYFSNPASSLHDPNSGACRLMAVRPVRSMPLEFDQFIRDTSPAFCEIYNEAHAAEQYGLTQVCGVGYRKALEFLIKDYLIKGRPNDTEALKRAQLGACIENYVSDPNTKAVAKRAVWLGNDETHYERRWVNKDLSDLHVMIRLVLHWIQAEQLTAEALNSMPSDRPATA